MIFAEQNLSKMTKHLLLDSPLQEVCIHAYLYLATKFVKKDQAFMAWFTSTRGEYQCLVEIISFTLCKLIIIIY